MHLVLDLIAGALFVLSSGLLFNAKFRSNLLAILCASAIAITSSYFLFEEITTRVVNALVDKEKGVWLIPNAEARLEAFEISPAGFGLVQVGMTIYDAYRALGLREFDPGDVNGGSVDYAGCFNVAPLKRKLKLEFLIELGKLARVSLWGEKMKTQKGIGIGSSLNDVKKAYPGVITTPHTYIQKGYYLTASFPNTPNKIVFDTENDKVVLIRSGAPPAVSYVERCF